MQTGVGTSNDKRDNPDRKSEKALGLKVVAPSSNPICFGQILYSKDIYVSIDRFRFTYAY